MDWKIDNAIPIYLQVMDHIRTDIAKGVYAPGSRLPIARDLAMANKINPNAVLRAIQILVSEDVVVLHDDGYFYVNGDVTANSNVRQMLIDKKLKEFVDGMRELGIDDGEMAGYVSGYVNG